MSSLVGRRPASGRCCVRDDNRGGGLGPRRLIPPRLDPGRGRGQVPVSRHMRRLRALTGDPLLVRSGAGMTPTTVALDLLVSDTGLQRHGVNFMLLWGDPDEGADSHSAIEHTGAS